MEIKKSQKADLEGKKSTGMLIGYVLILATIFVAFEWTQRDRKVVELEPVFESTFEEDMIPITLQKEQVVAPPPAAAPKVAEVLNIVEDDTELVEEEVETSEEVNQAITNVVGTGASTAVVAPVAGPVVEAVDEDRIFEVVEDNPEFPGGMEACLRWLGENIKYPSICQEQGVQGRVMVQFVVNKDGSIVDVKTVRSPDPYLTKEAERVVKLMPRWRPGRQGGKPVRVKFVLPVMFRLR
ncbi:MAG: energy transducer TonB [Paraprevotella sp.]|nr:energy transducer TonB [Paraprevotella sp.]